MTPTMTRLIDTARTILTRALDAAAEQALRSIEPIGQALDPLGAHPAPTAAGTAGTFNDAPLPTTPHPPVLVLNVGTRGEINGITYAGQPLPYLVNNDTDPTPPPPPGVIIEHIDLRNEHDRSAWALTLREHQ